MQTISNKQTCMLSQFYDWLICRNLQWLTADCCYHFLLVERVRHYGGQDQYCAVFVSRGGWYQVRVSFRLPPLQPSPVSWTIKQHACVRTRWAGDGSLERPLSSCVMRSVNSWWTCSDARNIGLYNSSGYRFRYDTDPIIVRSLDTTSLDLHYEKSTESFTTVQYSLICQRLGFQAQKVLITQEIHALYSWMYPSKKAFQKTINILNSKTRLTV